MRTDTIIFDDRQVSCRIFTDEEAKEMTVETFDQLNVFELKKLREEHRKQYNKLRRQSIRKASPVRRCATGTK